jgi:hypothetical protein
VGAATTWVVREAPAARADLAVALAGDAAAAPTATAATARAELAMTIANLADLRLDEPMGDKSGLQTGTSVLGFHPGHAPVSNEVAAFGGGVLT